MNEKYIKVTKKPVVYLVNQVTFTGFTGHQFKIFSGILVDVGLKIP